MKKNVFLLVSMCALLLTVGAPTAHAYISPADLWPAGGTSGGTHPAAPADDEYIDRTDLTSTEAPSLARDAERAIAEQQLASQLRREQEQEALFPSDEEEEVHAAAEDTSPARGLLDENNDQTEYDLRMQRMEENNDGRITIFVGGEGSVTTSDGTVLHSGAPRTAGTGPETVLMLTLFVLAGLSTLLVAYQRKKKFA